MDKQKALLQLQQAVNAALDCGATTDEVAEIFNSAEPSESEIQRRIARALSDVRANDDNREPVEYL